MSISSQSFFKEKDKWGRTIVMLDHASRKSSKHYGDNKHCANYGTRSIVMTVIALGIIAT